MATHGSVLVVSAPVTSFSVKSVTAYYTSCVNKMASGRTYWQVTSWHSCMSMGDLPMSDHCLGKPSLSDVS